MSATNKSKLLATTAVLSDVLKNAGTATATELTLATKAIADETIATYPNYPADSSGTNIFLEIPATTVAAAVSDPTATSYSTHSCSGSSTRP
ncbi:hypothetical protein ACLKMH_01920 [Psychromonas sp. KJ10-10]|uniref:hypothetical protein n=1 Tax=Psychromonas sp. KJ10-10 TaxID=3391823 RepID=UPI0039B4F154